MKRFDFPLSAVRDLRRRQLEAEEARLQALFVERDALQATALHLDREVSETRDTLMVTGSAQAHELVASDLYLRHLAALRAKNAAGMADWRKRAAAQQAVVVDAKRRVRLLEKLEAKQFREWQAGVDRAQENLAAELFLARWKK